MHSYSFVVADKQQLIERLAKLNLNSDTSSCLVQICSTKGSDEALILSGVLRSRLKNVTVIGHSTSHFIYNAQILEKDSLILITEFESASITSTLLPVSSNYAKDSLTLTSDLAISSKTKAVVSFADGIDSKDSELYGRFNHFEPVIPVAGGLAQKNSKGTWILLNDQVATNAIAAAALHGNNLHAWHRGFIEWNPIGRSFTVTKATGNIVLELDQQPCYDVYKHYLADGKNIPVYDINNFPLMQGSRIHQNVFIPEKILADGAMKFSAPVKQGAQVRFSYNHPSLTLEQVEIEREELRSARPDVLFIYNCSSRVNFAEGKKELKAFDTLLPANGSYFSGELCREEQQRILHHSLTYLALREGSADKRHISPSQPVIVQDKVSPLFSLIHNAIADADEMHSSMEKRLNEQTRKLTESYRLDHRTSLPNRIALKERLSRVLLNEHLVTLKLNNFRQVNEKYGHQIGDNLLQDISAYGISSFQRIFPGNEIYSIGVGEWAVILKSDVPAQTIKQHFYEFCEELEQIDFKPEGITEVDHLSVSLNAGIVSRRDFPDLSADELLIKSIETRRWARINNRHICSAKEFQPEIDHRQSQLNWLSYVSRAIIQNNVVTYAQPILSAHTHKEVSMECLVRIKDGSKIIAPGQFLSIIEGTHLYTRLSRQMIANTFQIMRTRHESFSLNLSPQDLMSDKTIQLLERQLLMLDDASRVGLEVLETEEIKDYGRLLEVCSHLRGLGAKIIVDDFGSGYSNIDEIIKLEPQVIKLDGSLVKNIDKDEKQRKITQTLVQLCQVFGAKTVAEFVHNEDVCRIAEDIGFDYLQGFYFAEPKLLE